MSDKIAIILCTFNGERFLQRQLDSFSKQTIRDWELFVYDDQSTDCTREIIKQFSKDHTVHWFYNEKKKGFSANFLEGILNTPDTFNYYAFSDQDDIWMSHKLERAISILKKKEEPSLYCSRTTLINENDDIIEYSPLFLKKPSFQNALIQSIAGGNTMVVNKKGYHLIKKMKPKDVVSHDWFIYQTMTGCGGDVHYDFEPSILYRQHDRNVIGHNQGVQEKIKRLKLVLRGDFKNWNEKNIKNLMGHHDLLTSKNKKTLSDFQNARIKKNIFSCIFYYLKSKVHRQKSSESVLVFLFFLFKKV